MARKPPEHDLTIEPVEDEGAVRLVLGGELDMSCAQRLDLAIGQYARPGVTVVLDLTGLEFMDSSGLAAILKASENSEQDGWDLKLTPASDPVDRIFDLTDTRRLLRFVD